ncbi:MAG: hypothetical protein LC101_01305 [Flavobacteriales bacterium]|nr:hypothetical protein [Flavobacteriales bacterium]
MNTGSTQPYLSIVMTARNDGHGGNLRERINASLIVWSALCLEYILSIEILLVEWNPLPSHPPLRDIIDHNYNNTYVRLRIITVPASVHSQADKEDPLAFHQMIAKNVGIRAAKGLFILCTNIDVFPDSNLIQLLAERELEENTFYRALRADIPASAPLESSVSKLIEYARRHIIRKMGMHPQWPGLKIYKTQYFLYRYQSLKFLYPFLLLIKQIVLGSFRYKISTIDKEASGDFTLMSKSGWIKIKGYHEWKGYPLHIDSLALIQAYFKGMKQVIFRSECCIYHIDHPGSWHEEDAPDPKTLPPYLSWQDILTIAEQIQKGRFDYNDDFWGLSAHTLKEEK